MKTDAELTRARVERRFNIRFTLLLGMFLGILFQLESTVLAIKLEHWGYHLLAPVVFLVLVIFVLGLTFKELGQIKETDNE